MARSIINRPIRAQNFISSLSLDIVSSLRGELQFAQTMIPYDKNGHSNVGNSNEQNTFIQKTASSGNSTLKKTDTDRDSEQMVARLTMSVQKTIVDTLAPIVPSNLIIRGYLTLQMVNGSALTLTFDDEGLDSPTSPHSSPKASKRKAYVPRKITDSRA